MNFEPHDYQTYAIDYIENHPVSAVLLDMGLGKTVISLTAIADLLFDSFLAHRILVNAPLRVARDTWPAELKKWSHLKHLTFAVAVGTPAERKAALMAGADITIINRENVQWLIEDSGMPFIYARWLSMNYPPSKTTSQSASRHYPRCDRRSNASSA